MDRKQRVLKGDLSDISLLVNSYREGSGSALLNTTTIYVGAEMPFNHKFFNILTPNNVAKNLSAVAIWNGSSWSPAVDVIDGTAGDVTISEVETTVSLRKSGAISWQIDPDKSGWSCVTDTSKLPVSSGLSTVRLFNLFWARITFSNADGPAVCDYVGERFCDDNDLFALYPDLRSSSLMASFKTGKTNWNEQCVIASENLIQYLRRSMIIFRREQILDGSLFNEAAVHKAAEVIFNGLGNGYVERCGIASKRFAQSVNIKFPEVDANGSGSVSMAEKQRVTILGTR